MLSYLTSLAMGVSIGVVYALLRVSSPAPPVVALVGLLGMLTGEHLVDFVGSSEASARAGSQASHAQIRESMQDLTSQSYLPCCK